MADENPIAVPRSEAGDLGHKAVKAVLGAVPFAGSGLAEFFDLIVAPPLRKKQDAWMTDVSAAIWDLKDRVEGFEPEKLSQSPVFASAVFTATQAAMKTTDETKLAALCNAVLNIATRPDTNAVERDLFLYLIDRLTPFHLQVLQSLKKYIIRKDQREFRNKGPNVNEFPVIASDVDLADLAARDLTECHLLSVPRNLFYSNSSLLWANDEGDLGTNHVEVTDLGERLLGFISEPE